MHIVYSLFLFISASVLVYCIFLYVCIFFFFSFDVTILVNKDVYINLCCVGVIQVYRCRICDSNKV